MSRDGSAPKIDPYEGQRTTPGPVNSPVEATEFPVDLTSPDVFANGFPHETLAPLQGRDGVFWHPESDPHEPGFWVLMRYEDIKFVSQNPGLFSSAKGAGPLISFERSGYDIPPAALAIYRSTMVGMDPPEHRAFRSVVMPHFGGPAVKRLEAVVRERVELLVAQIEPGKPFDLVRDYTAIAPAVALCELLGVPSTDHPKVIEWGDSLAGAEDPEYATASAQARVDMFAYGWQLLEKKKTQPGDDLLTAAIQEYSKQDGKLPFGAMEGLFAIMVLAGHRTTRNTTTIGLLELYERPAQLELLQDRPILIDNAVEEILRFSTVVPMFRRTATADTEIAGQPIAAGEKVVMCYALANRDPRVFDAPDSFDITRRNAGDHLSFGWGEHMCAGRKLARLEIRIAIQSFIERFRSLELVEAPQYLRTNQAVSIKNALVRASE